MRARKSYEDKAQTNIYTHAVSSKQRRAQSKVLEMILPEEKTTPVAAVSLNVYFLVYRADFPRVD